MKNVVRTLSRGMKFLIKFLIRQVCNIEQLLSVEATQPNALCRAAVKTSANMKITGNGSIEYSSCLNETYPIFFHLDACQSYTLTCSLSVVSLARPCVSFSLSLLMFPLPF